MTKLLVHLESLTHQVNVFWLSVFGVLILVRPIVDDHILFTGTRNANQTLGQPVQNSVKREFGKAELNQKYIVDNMEVKYQLTTIFFSASCTHQLYSTTFYEVFTVNT